ncbi:MAG: Gfo/Idh/MocA family oxidoreductase [Fidelibacterota bacterium]
MKNRPLQTGIVGVGRFGSRHADKWLSFDNVRLCGFYDIDPEVQVRIPETKNIPLLPLDTLIETSDLIDIVVPASSHYAVAKTALEAGKHVFIEKPFTETPEQALELCELARKNGSIVGIGHIERFNPVFLALEKNLPGAPDRLEACRQGPFIPGIGVDVSIILELMVHDIDIVRRLIPSNIINITADGEILYSNKIDRARAVLHFENGSSAVLFASRAENERRREITCSLNGNDYTADLMNRRLLLPGKTRPLDFGFYDAMADELHRFSKAVQKNQRHCINENDGLSSVKIASMIEKIILEDQLS